MCICVDFCIPIRMILQPVQAQQPTLTPLVLPLITYISVAIFHIPRNVSCYVSTTSWAEFARKKKKREFIFDQTTLKPKKDSKLNFRFYSLFPNTGNTILL